MCFLSGYHDGAAGAKNGRPIARPGVAQMPDASGLPSGMPDLHRRHVEACRHFQHGRERRTRGPYNRLMHDDDLKLTDPQFFAHGDPHAIWSRLRRTDPVHWTESRLGRNFWSVTRHADIRAVLGDNQRFSSTQSGPSLPTRPELVDAAKSEHARLQQAAAMLNSMDPPHHDRMRASLMQRFTPKRAKMLEGEIRAVSMRIISEAREKPSLDFVTDIAARLPIAIIFTMMDIPEADWPMLFRYANMHTAPEDPEFSIGTPLETRQQAIKGLVGYCRDLALSRRANPGDDLLSTLATIETDGRLLNDDELGANGHMFVIAGQETTRNSLTAGMHQLISNPAEMQRLRDEPRLLRTAPDESVRWGNPVSHLLRTALADVEIGGKTIAKGDWVVSWIASGNRDDAVFADPFRFDVGRSPNPQIGFGFGPHFCMGAFLARLEIQIMLECLLDEVEEFALDGDPQLVSSIQFCGFRSMPVNLKFKRR
jgi:cytochrome P450